MLTGSPRPSACGNALPTRTSIGFPAGPVRSRDHAFNSPPTRLPAAQDSYDLGLPPEAYLKHRCFALYQPRRRKVRSRALPPPHQPSPSRAALRRRVYPPPHQPSPAAGLLRLPLKGGLIEIYWKPCAGLYHSPLEGESVRQGLCPQSNRWGGRNRRDRHIGDPARSLAGGGR